MGHCRRPPAFSLVCDFGDRHVAIFTSQVDNAITLSAGAFDASASTGGGTVNGGSERVALLRLLNFRTRDLEMLEGCGVKIRQHMIFQQGRTPAARVLESFHQKTIRCQGTLQLPLVRSGTSMRSGSDRCSLSSLESNST